jgi:hypothetical protein
MKKTLLFTALVALLSTSCESSSSKVDGDTNLIATDPTIVLEDSIVTSFVFVGCNRLWWKDLARNNSSANTDALKNIFEHVSTSSTKTDYFFFLGDIVSGEATNDVLEGQLKAWNEDYDNGVFSDFKSSGIKMIPVPGNHEMLNQEEKPLEGTTDTWMKYMGKYMPTDRDSVPNSPVDRMTYGFTDGNIGFIVLNTDTYNTDGGIGVESQIPYKWVKQQVAAYNSDPTIDHIFVMGHRPFYVQCERDTTHQGMCDPAQSSPVWQSFEDNDVASMLSAHVHQYQRMQPNQKTYQLIAGNGGSPVHHHTPPAFFGYTRINVYASGRIEMLSEGYDAPTPYFDVVENPDWSIRDSLFDMNWYKKGAKNDSVCSCVIGE